MTWTESTVDSKYFTSYKKAFLTDQPRRNLESNLYGQMGEQDHDKQCKVCFAESLETVHEVPPYHKMFSKADFHSLSLPSLPVHKYAPLIVCDPFAKPVKKKKLDKLFVDDPFKLPFINTDGMAFGLSQKSHGKNRVIMNKNQVKKTAVKTNAFKGEKGEKRNLGNTLHFRYSDFILRKMDAVSYDKN